MADFDCPTPPGECVLPACVGGLCTSKPTPAGAPCDIGCHCDGAGACVGPKCVSDAICFSPNACAIGKCVGCEICTIEYVPAGTPVPGGPKGDCKATTCDGAGQIESVPDDNDVPDDGDPCTIDGCVNGAPVHQPKCPAPQTCNQGVCSP